MRPLSPSPRSAAIRRSTRPGTGSRAACAAHRHRRFPRRCQARLREDAPAAAAESARAPRPAPPRVLPRSAATPDERTQQPGPDRALMVGAVALAHAALVAPAIIRIGRIERAQTRAASAIAPQPAPAPTRATAGGTQACGSPPAAKIWLGRTRRSAVPATPSGSTTSTSPPVASSGNSARNAARARSSMAAQRAPSGQPRRDGQRVDPQRLHLDRLADARRDHPVAHLGVHPGQLHARLAAGDQPVRVQPDAEARAGRIALQDGGAGRAQPIGVGIRHASPRPAGRAPRR